MLAGILILVAALALLAALQWTHARRVRRERRAIFEGLEDVLDRPELTQDGIGYPTLAGTLEGQRVELRLLPDGLAARRLPRLWLAVTFARPLPIEGPVDILLRPHPDDFVSAGERFKHVHQPPPGWPESVRIATPDGRLPPPETFDAVKPLVADPKTKNVLIAPGGVRIVHELAQADRSLYLYLRRSKFEIDLSRQRLTALLDAASRLARALA